MLSTLQIAITVFVSVASNHIFIIVFFNMGITYELLLIIIHFTSKVRNNTLFILSHIYPHIELRHSHQRLVPFDKESYRSFILSFCDR